MFIKRKNYLAKIDRIRVAEGRNLAAGLRLDRNERVDAWQKDIFERIFSDKPGYFLSVYPELTPLYKKLAAFHGVTESELLLTSGIDGGLKTLFEVVTEPDDVVGVVSPTYAMYKVYARLFQVHLHEIEYTAQLQFNYAEFEAFLGKKPTMFFLPNPNQPVESAFSKAQLEDFARKTLQRGCLFLIDEAYHMFGCDSGIDLIQKYENVVVARTFSKGFGVPSIRLGYMISNQENMGILAKTRFAHESNALSNAVAEFLLDNYSIVENYNRAVVAAREALKPIMQGFGIDAAGANGNFLLLDLGNQTRAKEYVEMLRARNIYVKGPWSGPWNKYVTITVGPMESMRRFVDATAEFVRLDETV